MKILYTLSVVMLFKVIFICGQLMAQTTPDLVKKMMPNPVPASPNVGALGKYGDYPVSYFTGLPEISIPIYEVQSGALSIPITLSYHASGIKPTDVGSWVGTGWSLSTGGQISRSLNGRADESIGNGYSLFPLNPSPSLTQSYYYLANAANNISDLEPDVFSYSFRGRSGKFMWTYSNGPYLFPYAPIKINSTTGLNTFEITDEDGVISRFGQNGSVENSTTSDGINLPTGGRSAWHLTEMVAPNTDDQIVIDYQSAGSFSMRDISYSFTVSDACMASIGASCPPEQPPHAQLYNIDSSGDQMGPSTIWFDNGRVKFFLNALNREDVSTLKYLDRIEIQNIDGTVVHKTIKFIYSNFTSANGSKASLKLDEVQVRDMDAPVQTYKFGYFTNTVSWRRGDNTDLKARDLWGYYNGATGNTDLLLPKTIPYIPNVGPATTVSFGGAFNRNVNPAYVKEGVLNKITFPTGGFTEFDYESNKYLKDGTPTLTGGLRVTKITSNDGSISPPIVRTYKYGANESGYGEPNFWEAQFNYTGSQYYIDDSCWPPFTRVSSRTRTYQSSVAYSYEANPIMYPYVAEHIGDLQDTNGKTSYVFDGGVAVNDITYFVPASGKFYRNSLAWKRGQLTNKAVYDKNNNKLSEVLVNYTTLKHESRHVGFGVHQYSQIPKRTCLLGIPEGGGLNEMGEEFYENAFYWQPYYQNSGSSLEASRVENNFELGNVNKFVSTLTTNVYHPEKLQLLQNSKSASNGTVWTVNKYPFDFFLNLNASSTGEAEGLYMLNQKNIITKPIETYTYLQKDGTDRVLSGTITTFLKNSTNTNQVVANGIYLWESISPVPITSYAPISINAANSGITMDSKFVRRIDMIKYDQLGNLLSLSKTNDIRVAYLYGYNKTLPIAEATNALDTEIFVQNFEELTGMETQSPHTGKKYKSGNYTVLFTKPNSRNYIVEYWYLSGTNWIYATNTYSNGMTLTGGTAIDNVRVYPSDARMKTYTYAPGIGISSVLDENGRILHYNYDLFGRLSYIKNEQGGIEKQYSYNYKN